MVSEIIIIIVILLCSISFDKKHVCHPFHVVMVYVVGYYIMPKLLKDDDFYVLKIHPKISIAHVFCYFLRSS